MWRAQRRPSRPQRRRARRPGRSHESQRLIFARSEELPATEDKRRVVSQLGNIPADVLVGVVEKLVAKMDEAELYRAYAAGWSAMPDFAVGSFTQATFEAFRERGESSEDAAEGAGTTIERIEEGNADAFRALMRYAHQNPGVLKEATALFVRRRPDLVGVLPATLYDAIEQRLSAAT